MSQREAALLQAYRETDYRVRLAGGGHASIHIGHALPAALQAPAEGGGFLTAWNPDSEPRSRADNRQAQRQLLQQLQTLPGCQWRAGLGIGRTGWHEASLWITGLTAIQLDRLAVQYGQRAWVGTDADGKAVLRCSGELAQQAATA